MNTKLPIAIVIPHSGLETPPELIDSIALSEEQIFNEADVYTDLIYDFRDHVEYWHMFPYSRAIIDVNRPNSPMPQIREWDGIVKHKTSYGATVYKDGQEPDAELEKHLIQIYWQPWHHTMATISQDERIKLVLDCHSMAALGPSGYGDPAQVRPRITASNLGDYEGNPTDDNMPLSAPPALTRLVAKQFGEVLGNLPDFAKTSKAYDVNQPFSGGPIIWIHGGKAQSWLMIELSRATYIGEQTGDSPTSPPKTERINHIKESLWNAIVEIVEQL